jgi:hypothetical protein
VTEQRRRGLGTDLVPMMVLVPEQQRAAMLAAGAPGPLHGRLDELYDDAMARFDAFCFWHARPARSLGGLREIVRRLEAYGSPEALRIAGEVRAALAEG